MRLKNCYIEGFGAIKQKTINFDENITAFCEENGYGKTTLATFLEAMFYGMKSYNGNSKGMPTRKHYIPFDGGKYGGYIEFERGGDIYRIERYFDQTNDARDKLKVYKNGNDTSELGADVGKSVFGLDQLSFRRTVFIGAGDIEISSTDGINEKLGAIVAGGSEAKTQSALAALKDEANRYQRQKTSNALIPREKAKINELKNERDNLQSVKDSLPDKYAKYDGYEKELKELRKKIETAQNTELALKDWEQYDEYQNAAEERRKDIERLEEKYPHGVPEADELKAAREAISTKTALEKQTGNLLAPSENAELETLKEKFDGKTPTPEIIADISREINSVSELTAELKSEQNAAPAERENALRNKFQGNVPEKSALDAIEEAASEFRQAENTYADTPDYIIEQPTKTKAGGKKYPIIAAVFVLIAAAGIGVTFFSLAVGIAVSAAGLVGLLVTGFLYLNKKTGAATQAVQIPNPEKAACARRRDNAENRARQLLLPYGYPADKSVDFLVESLKNDVAEYGKILKADAEKSERIANLSTKLAQTRQKIDGFFALYAIGGESYGEMLTKLQTEIGRRDTLTRTREKLREQNESAFENIQRQETIIKEFCEKRGFDPAAISKNLEEIESDASTYRQARADYERYARKAESFKAEKLLESRPVKNDGGKLEQLNAAENELNSGKIKLAAEITECENDAERLDALLNEIADHEQTLEKYQKEYDIICKTSDFIKQAQTRLTDRYVKPIKDNFIKYANMLEKTLGEKVTMTSKFEIRFDRGGEAREEKYLSAGQLTLCDFCFRIALIDNMYQNEKPFLILDDPFSSLDENHFKKAAELLKSLSKDLQIIYFTCHPTRAI